MLTQSKVASQRTALQIMRYSLEYQVEVFNEYIKNMNSSINTSILTLRESYINLTKNMDHSEKEIIDDDFSLQHEILNNHQRNIFSSSTIISLHSYIELSTKQLQLYLENQHINSTKKKQIRKIHMKDTIMFFQKKYTLDITTGPEWGFIDDLRIIRNAIAHAGGIINNELIYDKYTHLISKSSLNAVEISEEYLLESVKKIETFLYWLYTQNFSDYK